MVPAAEVGTEAERAAKQQRPGTHANTKSMGVLSTDAAALRMQAGERSKTSMKVAQH